MSRSVDIILPYNNIMSTKYLRYKPRKSKKLATDITKACFQRRIRVFVSPLSPVSPSLCACPKEGKRAINCDNKTADPVQTGDCCIIST